MKLFTFKKDGHDALGIYTDAGHIDMETTLENMSNHAIFKNVMDVIRGGEQARIALQSYVNSALESEKAVFLNEDEIEWGPSVTHPRKILCVGLNYRKHADETKASYPEVPILFNKFDNALTGHKQKVVIPKETERLDYEVELAIIIGKRAKYVDKEEALDYVLGYSTANDLSARDLQKRTPQWLLGKTCDGFNPLGPYLVTKDEIHNPDQLTLKTYVNSELRQNSNTEDMIFDCAHIVSYISQYMTLEPGDVILTGTPEGVVIGMPKEKRVYLQAGDEVTVEVEKLGKLTNYFVSC